MSENYDNLKAQKDALTKTTFDKIKDWADDRNLIEGATPASQLEKFFEECGEFARAIVEGDAEKLKDAIGDFNVVATIIAAQHGLEMQDCIDFAYNEIKDRRGKMVDGIFVKEES